MRSCPFCSADDQGAHAAIHLPHEYQAKSVCHYFFDSSAVLTTKEYMRIVSEIKPEWLVEIAPHYYSKKVGDRVHCFLLETCQGLRRPW